MDTEPGFSPGHLIGDRYIIERQVAGATMSSIYQASTIIEPFYRVAVKLFKPDNSGDDWLLSRFMQEQEALGRIEHPNIIELLHLGETAHGTPYFVMPFIEGRNLRTAIRDDHPMDLFYAALLIQQIGYALSFAHQRGVFHRDIKPDHILLEYIDNQRERVKIIDFGLAGISGSQVRTTRDGFITGTPGYMPPWDWAEDDLSAVRDTYALGILSYEMVTGVLPFPPYGSAEAPSMKELRVLQQARSFKSPRELRPDLPEAAEAAILKALSPERQNNFSTTSEFADELFHAITGMDHPVIGATVPMPEKSEAPSPGSRETGDLSGVSTLSQYDPDSGEESARPTNSDESTPSQIGSSPPGAGWEPAPSFGGAYQASPSLNEPTFSGPPNDDDGPSTLSEWQSSPPPASATPPRYAPAPQSSPYISPALNEKGRPSLIGGAIELVKELFKGSPQTNIPAPVQTAPQVHTMEPVHRVVHSPALTGATRPNTEVVDCTVYAPPEVHIGQELLVQIFAHCPDQAERARQAALEFDPGAIARGVRSLASEIEQGSQLSFHLVMPGLEIDEVVQTMIWRGKPESVQFGVRVPMDKQAGVTICTVTISQNNIPLGHIKFKLNVASTIVRDRGNGKSKLAAVGDDVRAYKKAFISYASQDRTEVLKRVQMLSRLHIDFFQDLLDLEPGAKWEQELYRHIDESDLFLLFWSQSAKKSEWVSKEVRYAIARKAGNELAAPEILPVLIDGPPPADPPAELSHLHFNDYLLYFMVP